jgi:hypothetical protein
MHKIVTTIMDVDSLSTFSFVPHSSTARITCWLVVDVASLSRTRNLYVMFVPDYSDYQRLIGVEPAPA